MSRRRRSFDAPSHLANGRFEVLAPLGSGGMATVYRVMDHWNNEERALKLLSPVGTKAKTQVRFMNEAHTMAQLDHPHIVRIYDVGEEDDGHRYFVMELAELGSVSHLMRRIGPLSVGRALRFALQSLAALEYAHTAGVIHRDIKPHNLLLTEDEQIKLTDFGIARTLSGDAGITGTGDMLGTVAYMAPEQRLDPRRVGASADLYALGATLYAMLTARRPLDLALAKLDPTVYERLPAPLRPIIRRSTAHRADDRYPSAYQMAQALALAWEEVDSNVRASSVLEPFDPDADDTIMQVSAQTWDT